MFLIKFDKTVITYNDKYVKVPSGGRCQRSTDAFMNKD